MTTTTTTTSSSSSAIDQGAAAVSEEANKEFVTSFSSYQQPATTTGLVPVSTVGQPGQFATVDLSHPEVQPAVPEKKRLSTAALIGYLILATIIIGITIIVIYYLVRVFSK